jgi:hypothetical protein
VQEQGQEQEQEAGAGAGGRSRRQEQEAVGKKPFDPVSGTATTHCPLPLR